MVKYAIRKLAFTILVLLGAATLAFILLHSIPGDTAEALAGPQATAEDVENLRRAMGLDAPILEQYFVYIKNLLHGDLGISYTKNMPVFDIVRDMSVLSPEFAEQEYDQSMMLLEKCRKSVHKMAEDGMLRPGLSEERAAELYWSISTPGIHRRLTKMLNWSSEEYAAWVSYLIGVTLLDWDSPMPFLNEGPRKSGLASLKRKAEKSEEDDAQKVQEDRTAVEKFSSGDETL